MTTVRCVVQTYRWCATTDFEKAREHMVRSQVLQRGVRDPRVLDALLRVPRHAFVPLSSRRHAYDDCPLPIGEGQTISQPYMVGRMSELLALSGLERVLEIGTGSGYQAAVLSLLARSVVSYERVPRLAESAQDVLSSLGYANIEVRSADGTSEIAEGELYDAILVAAGAPCVPHSLVTALSDVGRIVIPVGDMRAQTLLLGTRTPDGRTAYARHDACAFVPLLGVGGWPPAT